MGKNKNIRKWLGRSSTSKAKKAVSQSANSKNQTDPDNPAGGDGLAVAAELQTTDQAQLGFPDTVYLLASVIFQNNHLEKPAAQRLVNYGNERGLLLPEVKNEEMHRTAYELAFNTLKYQELLEDIMIDSRFYLSQQMPNDKMSLAAVMLYDFQDRKFLPRECPGDKEMIQDVRDVDNFLFRCKTKLAASLARCRIKRNLLSIECILPESVKRKQERSSSIPLYAWVNTWKSSLNEVQSLLQMAGFLQVKSIGQLEGQTFCQDPHCRDVLIFPAQLKAQLYSTELLSNHKLIIQDKSCSLGPNTVCSLLPEEGDVLIVGCVSGLTVSHTSSLIAEKQKADCNNHSAIIYVCVSDCTSTQREDLQQAVTDMGCKNVRLIPEDFQALDGGDERVQKVRIILLIPKCSVSAISNPVDFILQENGDLDLLQDLSRDSIAQSKLEALVAQQKKDIDHALKFPKVLAVIYSTCSLYTEENEVVVSKALDQAKARSKQEEEPRQATFRLSPFPLCNPEHAENPEETELFFTLKPSELSNGCFLAVLCREPEPVVKEAPHEVILRANAKGILNKIGTNQPTRKDQHGQTNRLTKTTNTCSSQSNLSISGQSKKQECKSSSSASLCGHQEFNNRQQSSQGKANSLRLQAVKNCTSRPFSTRKQESSSCPSLPNPVSHRTSKKSFTPVFKTTTANTYLHPAPPPVPTAPPRPVTRPRKTPMEVLKPVVLVFPPPHFPSFFPPQLKRRGINPSFNYSK